MVEERQAFVHRSGRDHYFGHVELAALNLWPTTAMPATRPSAMID